MSGNRESVSLQAPPSDDNTLRAFPTKRLGAEERIFRVVNRSKGPWWFGNTGAGRFDLLAPEGTCYLARDDIGALLEVVAAGRTDGAILESDLTNRRLVKLRVPKAHSLSDLAHRRAAAFGITAEIGTIVPYDLPRSWAASLRSSGSDGLEYSLRHDPAGSKGVALFGQAGERTDWPPGESAPIDERLRRRLERESGLRVIPRPRLSDLRIEDPEPS